MMMVLRLDIRDFIAEARTEMFTNAKPMTDSNEDSSEWSGRQETHRKNMKQAFDELNKVVEE